MIIGMMLVRNEADRYLRASLGSLLKVCDKVVVLDDHSKDDTPDICRKLGAEVWQSEARFSDCEWTVRQQLWHLVTETADAGDWIVSLDADEIITEPEELRDELRTIGGSWPGVSAVGMRLFDMWGEDHYRDDALWCAHKGVWVRAVRYDPLIPEDWRQSKLHCGSFPYHYMQYLRMLASSRILHYSYATPEDRRRKYEWYIKTDTCGDGIQEQYDSILDAAPHLVKLRDAPMLVDIRAE
ncbi:MAG: glycosyltransferase [Clostridia bacterium]|nr:glycosyltransferase [Clostridia bacterium]